METVEIKANKEIKQAYKKNSLTAQKLVEFLLSHDFETKKEIHETSLKDLSMNNNSVSMVYYVRNQNIELSSIYVELKK